MRANETPEEHLQRNRADAARKAVARAIETPAEHARKNLANSQQKAAARANETEEQHLQRNQANAERQAIHRANRTPDEVLRDRSAARRGMAASRKYSTAGFRDATRSQEILQGTFHVLLLLEDTVDTIGEMDHECDYCGALKFAKETPITAVCV